jgi:hypothetical protein
MATQVQFRRGTTVDISTFIGADGEVVVDTTKKTCVVNDGVQIAGYPLLREDGSNSALSVGSLSSCALKFVNDPNTGIISPGADQIALVTGGASRLSVDSSGSVTIPGNLLVAGSVTGSITFDNGSAALPALRFTNDPDTGIYLAGTNELAISTGGTQRLTTTTTAVTSTLPVIHPLGAAATPSLTFTGDTNTGIYSPGADQVAISTNGTQRLTTDTAAVTSTLPVVHPLGAAATPSLTFAGDLNTGIYSPGADQVAVATNGTGRLFVDANGTVRVNSAIQATSNGGLNVEATSNGSSSAPFTLLNRGTSNDTGVFLTYRGLSSASAETDYAYMQMLATDTSSRHGAIAFWTANSGSVTERLRITSAGNVGIGASSPSVRLQVTDSIAGGSDNTIATLHNFSDTGGDTRYAGLNFRIGSDNGTSAIRAYRTNTATNYETNLSFWTNPVGATQTPLQAMTIDSYQRVGIGTTSPGDKLDVFGIVRATNTTDSNFYSTFSNPDGLTRIRAYGGGSSICFDLGTSEKARIDSSGRLGIGTSSPVATNHIRGSGTSGQVTASWMLENTSSGSVGMDVTGAAGSSIWRFLYANGPLTGTNAFTPALTIGVEGAAAGNVGIGTTSPNSVLQVNSGTNLGGILVGFNAGSSNFYDADLQVFRTGNGTERARIDSSGRLLVGTSSARSNFLAGSAAARVQIENAGEGTAEFSGVRNVSSASGGLLILGKSRFSAIGSVTTVINGDQMGWISFQGADGTNLVEGASIRAEVDGTPGANDMPGRLTFSTCGDGASSATERMRITSAGLVGIGSAVPNEKLTVADSGSANVYIALQNSTTGTTSADGWYLGAAGTEFQIYGKENGPITFSLNSSEKARIDTSGRLLVGTSTARTDYFNNTLTAMLQVEGTNASGAVDRACVSIVNNNNVTINEAPVLVFGRSNGATVNSKTLVSNGTRCGYISFQGADGGDLVEAASISGEIDGTPGANDMPGRLVFSTTADGASSPTERMRITKEGASRFFCSTGADAIDVSSAEAAGTSRYLFLGAHSATGTGTGTNCYRVYTNGNVENTNNSYGAISDIKLKENIVDASPQWDDLKALQVRNYNFKEGQTHTQIGLVAQEVELVSPGLVSESPDRDAEGNDLGTVTKSVNYSVLYMKAVKALQEAMERIEALEADVAQLKGA